MHSIINKILIAILPALPKFFIKIFSKKYVAGTTINEALEIIKKLNIKNHRATIDILGEHTQSKNECINITNEYIEILEKINDIKLDCNLSIKPSHIGYDINKEFMLENFKKIQSAATQLNNFIRLDMENSELTEVTIDTFNQLNNINQNVGLVFQAYLKRTKNDIKKYKNINIRLCKGIYNESENISYQDYNDINDNFIKILKIAFNNNIFVGIATHDKDLISKSIKTIKDMNIQKHQFEFQFLYGVPMNDMIKLYKENNYNYRVYVPFGINWYEYSIRRIKENPKIATYVLKNFLKRK